MDAFHLIGLVSFCDLFNHSADAHTSLVTDAYVCPICGSLQACEHDESEMERLSHLSEGQRARLLSNPNCVEMYAERNIEGQEEVFSCYEQNAGPGKVLVEWGFMPHREEWVGDGLVWEPRQLLSNETVGPYMALLDSDTSIPHPETTSELVLDGGFAQPGLLSISLDGRLSINLLLAIWLRALENGTLQLESDDLEKGFVDLLQHLQERSINGSDEKDPLATNVLSLIDERLGGMHQCDMPLVYLGQEVEVSSFSLPSTYRGLICQTLPTDAPLQAMAMRLAFEERTTLDSARSRWHLG